MENPKMTDQSAWVLILITLDQATLSGGPTQAWENGGVQKNQESNRHR
jgi:hypothetical protein